MSTTPTDDGPAPAGPTREYRATATFLIGGTLMALVILLDRGVLQATPPIRGLVAGGGVLLGIVALLSASIGLATSRAWAVGVVTPMLVVLVVAGMAQLFWALTHGSIDIPIAGLLALWALRAPVHTSTGTRAANPGIAGVAGGAVLVTLLVSAGMPLIGGSLLQAGGPLVAGEDALQPSLVVTCGDLPGGEPTFIAVAYDWSWARSEPLAAGLDTITLAWSAVREDDATGYQLDPPGQLGAGIDEANVIVGRSSGLVYGVDLAERGFAPGSLRLSLSPSGAPPIAHGTVEFSASYLHAPADSNGPDSPAIWRVHSTARCDW